MYILLSVVKAGEVCASHSKPPLLVCKMAPSEPTAQPCLLSAAKRIALMAFPCGSGFCHSQAREGDCAIAKEGRAAISTKNNAAGTNLSTRRLAAAGLKWTLLWIWSG